MHSEGTANRRSKTRAFLSEAQGERNAWGYKPQGLGGRSGYKPQGLGGRGGYKPQGLGGRAAHWQHGLCGARRKPRRKLRASGQLGRQDESA
ncbi:unnamed protein product [Rangifer tarandus platyrhynchus]|uniref:Uncharacterized protein n=2 Tax=Rangifer tarandus platyrhynchus TaxID=3082113 RepID=A0ACB0DZP2_RANTA|nr:unnamed protein product [Rangifer tarandus platyrhynchus]CAI9693721.1 unnamed protein product [Rangifer tarandus platyrhynchus]